MSDVGRYRRLYPRLWRHPGFLDLTKTGRELALYLLSGPQTNRLGCFHFSIATASEDLNVAVETVRKGLADVSATFGWTFDGRSRVFYIPSWWRWNPPANANVLKGNLKDLNEIPPCGLLDAFVHNLETLDPTFHQTFIEGCRQRLPEHSPVQNQNQDLQKQKQEYGASRRGQRTESTRTLESISGAPIGTSGPVVKAAHDAIRMNGVTSIDELIESTLWILNQSNFAAKRADVVTAVNVALAENRQGVAG